MFFSLDLTFFISSLGALTILGLLLHRLLHGPATASLPPGPKPLPLIGNLHQIPKAKQWLELYKWSKEYGPIMYMNMAGQHFVVLSSDQAAQDLLTRRGAQYSDRPRRVMCGDIVTRGMHMLLRPYDAAYRLHQRMQAPLLNVRAAKCYQPLQDIESKQLLVNVLAESDAVSADAAAAAAAAAAAQTGTTTHNNQGLDLRRHFERATASFIYSVMYGYRLRTGREQTLQDAQKVQHEFARTGVVGAYLVDAFPRLNYLPAWLAPWKREGAALFALEHNLHVGNRERGLRNPGWNFTKHYEFDCAEARGMPRVEVAFDLGILSDAALDTSTMALTWFSIAALGCGGGRGWVATAQAQLDAVVGRRLPEFEDRDKLVYIDAIVNETLRWRPVVINGAPHYTNVEDSYMGYRIPAKSIVLANHFAVSRDEAAFGPNTHDFLPERWIADDGTLKDLPQTGFGFGRRICTGRHIAKNQLFIQIARILWAFTLDTRIIDETGAREVVDDMAGNDGFIFVPDPCKSVCTPRGPWVRSVIKELGSTFDIDYTKVLDQAGKERVVKIR